MRVRIEITRAAARDFGSIEEYIASDNPPAAAKLLERVSQEIDKLADFPELGRAGRVSGSRELVIAGTPYIVAYRVRGEVIQVLRVLHGAQRWPGRM